MPTTHTAPEQHIPTNNNGYLEILTKAAFQSGMSWKVIEAKWPGFLEVFHDFDIDKIAEFDESDIDRLTKDTRIIRHGGKIKATIHNAETMQELIKKHGSIKKWLKSIQNQSFEDRFKLFKQKFKFMGRMGVYYFLYVVGEPVPPHKETFPETYSKKK